SSRRPSSQPQHQGGAAAPHVAQVLGQLVPADPRIGVAGQGAGGGIEAGGGHHDVSCRAGGIDRRVLTRKRICSSVYGRGTYWLYGGRSARMAHVSACNASG